MQTLIAGNWKMNTLPSEAEDWALKFKDALHQVESGAEVLICAPFTHLMALSAVFSDSWVQVGAQDVSTHEKGAYTGEVSGAMLKDAGVSYVIIGHSERRAYHFEDDVLVNEKTRVTLAAGLRPIVCVGESEAEREAGNAEDVVLKQLRAALDGVTFNDVAELVIAYEPVWAIGTGKTATAEDAQTMCLKIRTLLDELYNNADEARILYGGSMKPANAAELLAKPDINGGLIGGASLSVDDLLAILKAT